MGILDEAIREHLELKRQHGADQTELEKLEDEAFGPPGRPGDEGSDSLAEAPTEFMAQPDAPAVAEPAPSPRSESATRIADLQEAPETAPSVEEAEEPAPAADDEEPSATEHEIVSEPAPSGPTTEEREVIAEQPTEMHDVEEELAEEDLGDADADVVDLEEDEEDDDFWDEKRLSDELDQALEAPIEQEEVVEEDEVDDELVDEERDSEAPAAKAGDEDVLEETPEFLEQSPEDDELWFEQKPPKDFDFDD
jgi:hypothetical protein